MLNWALRPLARLIFPRVPEGGPAMNAILMNLSANILGLGNAATLSNQGHGGDAENQSVRHHGL